MSRQVFGDTHPGLVRDNNQDRYDFGVIDDNMVYSIVCDGMGGENGGGVAAEIAVKFAKKTLERDLSVAMTELSIRAVFSSIFSATNALVWDTSTKEPLLKGMGTTMILAVLKDNTLFVGTVGDSRVYLANEETHRQITTDHTVVQMMVDKGEISKEDACIHPKRHYITRAVGVSDCVDMDFLAETIEEDEIILSCSDGLYNYIDEKNIHEYLKQSVKDASVKNLIEQANQNGGGDNITAVVIV